MAAEDYRDELTGEAYSSIWRSKKKSWNFAKIGGFLKQKGVPFFEYNGQLNVKHKYKIYKIGLFSGKVREKGTNVWVPFRKSRLFKLLLPLPDCTLSPSVRT